MRRGSRGLDWVRSVARWEWYLTTDGQQAGPRAFSPLQNSTDFIHVLPWVVWELYTREKRQVVTFPSMTNPDIAEFTTFNPFINVSVPLVDVLLNKKINYTIKKNVALVENLNSVLFHSQLVQAQRH